MILTVNYRDRVLLNPHARIWDQGKWKEEKNPLSDLLDDNHFFLDFRRALGTWNRIRCMYNVNCTQSLY